LVVDFFVAKVKEYPFNHISSLSLTIKCIYRLTIGQYYHILFLIATFFVRLITSNNTSGLAKLSTT
jgi:hypothetical protein